MDWNRYFKISAEFVMQGSQERACVCAEQAEIHPWAQGNGPDQD